MHTSLVNTDMKSYIGTPYPTLMCGHMRNSTAVLIVSSSESGRLKSKLLVFQLRASVQIAVAH